MVVAVTQRERENCTEKLDGFLLPSASVRLVIDSRVTPDICLAIPSGDRSVAEKESYKAIKYLFVLSLPPFLPSPHPYWVHYAQQ